jgi:hypothetical protein
VNCFEFETLDGADFQVIDPYVGEGRFFGNISTLFSNGSSIISIVAIFIGGIILFGQFTGVDFKNTFSTTVGQINENSFNADRVVKNQFCFTIFALPLCFFCKGLSDLIYDTLSYQINLSTLSIYYMHFPVETFILAF